MREKILKAFEESAAVKQQFVKENVDTIIEVSRMIADSLNKGGKLLLFGNGGSSTDASHIAAEFVNRFMKDRPPFPAIALNTDMAVITSISNDYDYSETLLSLSFATVPYREVPIRIPLLNLIVNYPLTSASDSIYQMKNENLPKDIFFDSPQNDFGDKDKLAHFFGAAFLSYSSLFFDLGDLFGYFVEAFEEDFKVQSSIDERDLVTNNLGDTFGKLLKRNKEILPSQILLMRTLYYFGNPL